MQQQQFAIKQRYLSGYEQPRQWIDFIVNDCQLDLSNIENQEWLCTNVLQYPSCKLYPLSHDYCQFVLKELIQYLEALQQKTEEMEIFDALYDSLVQYQTKTNTHEWFHRIFIQQENPNHEFILKVFPEFKQVGLAMWPSGFFITEYMLHNKTHFQNRRMLELGSGIGFTAMICHEFIFESNHSADKECIVVTDYLDSVLWNSFENMQLNHIPCLFEENQVSSLDSKEDASKKIQIAKLDWTTCTLEQIQTIQPNLLLAADVIYDTSVISHLVRVVDLCFTCDAEMECLFAITKRNENTFALFEAECAKRGIHSEVVPFSNPSPHFYVKFRDSTIITLRRFFKQKKDENLAFVA